MKKFDTKFFVAVGIGAALFFILFAYVQVPTPVPNTSLKVAYGISAFLGVFYGPIAAFLIAFIGHALTDFILYGSPWWSWIIASGIAALIGGLASYHIKLDEKELDKKDLLIFNLYQIIGHIIAWLVVAPLLDIIIYSEPAGTVFLQGVTSTISNAILGCVISTILLIVYSKSRTQKGSLSKR